MKADVKVWLESPCSVSVPAWRRSGAPRIRRMVQLAAHSEMTRVLSEHGLLGLIAICLDVLGDLPQYHGHQAIGVQGDHWRTGDLRRVVPAYRMPCAWWCAAFSLDCASRI